MSTDLGAIDWHSFTQLILRPYGWQPPSAGVPPNDLFAEAVGDDMAAAIEAVHGFPYTNQPSADLYPVCGCAIDVSPQPQSGARLIHRFTGNLPAREMSGPSLRVCLRRQFLYETTLGVTFTMELRPATSGGGGFILPPAQIVPTGEENMAGFVVYAERVLSGLKDGSWSPRNATKAL